MRAKKLLSLTLSAAMVMAPMTVSAASATPDISDSIISQNGVTSVNRDINGYTITGSGSANAVSKNQYKVVLPTSEALKFVLDPQGLLSLTSGNSASMKDLAATAGGVHPASNSANAVIQNKSSMPVTVSVNLTASGTSNINLNNTSRNDLETDDTSCKALLAVVPSMGNTVGKTTYTRSSRGLAITNAGIDIEFYLKGGNWTVSNDAGTFSSNYVNGGNGTAFSIGGFVNRRADWKAVADALTPSSCPTVTATFKLDAASDTAPDFDPVTKAFGLVSDNSRTSNSYVLLSTVKATPDGKAEVINGEGLASLSNNTYPIKSLYYAQSANSIDTSTFPDRVAVGDTYSGCTVKEMVPSRYTWNKTNGTLQLNSDIVASLKKDNAHLVYFFVAFDGTVIQSNEVVFE